MVQSVKFCFSFIRAIPLITIWGGGAYFFHHPTTHLFLLPFLRFDFDFNECFMTTFLRAHSWLNWVDEDDDEDEVGLKEKPEDTRYIKKITSK